MIVRAHDKRSAQLRLEIEMEEKDFNGLVLYHLAEDLKKLKKATKGAEHLDCPRCGTQTLIRYKTVMGYETTDIKCHIRCPRCGYLLGTQSNSKAEARYHLMFKHRSMLAEKENNIEFYDDEPDDDDDNW